ncbi:MAG: tRNA pseudouridine(55) synthase TruB [Syntrophorhabdaceae bacterium]|nr:tRNA pseudouridine(55) synthase TruB [Syntrophorhabdales bacterium]MBP9560792.1 tRNA pseudouridine(55) synthase TruB [Syntrophorhabdaceae bacterium]
MNGFLIVDKSPGISSYDVIRRLKRLSRFKKIGYIGTLDKNATGVLPVAINEGVKLIPLLEDYEKVYKARVLLGVQTDTYDIEGKVLSEKPVTEYKIDDIEGVLRGFLGDITQKVPMFSSKKVNRRPLYKLARKGIEIDPPEKNVRIYNISIKDYSHPYVDIEVTCSKGTYIRSLANDFGNILGCGATLFSLKRTKHGEFTSEMSIDIDEIKNEADLERCLIPLKDVLPHMNRVTIDNQFERFLRQGMPVPIMSNTDINRNDEFVKLFNRRNELIAIGFTDTKTNTIKVKRLINN